MNALPMFEKLRRYLERQNIQYNIVREGAMVDFIVETRHQVWECTATILDDQKAFVVHSVMLDPIPPHLRAEMALFINVLNSARVIGNFEMDIDEGEVRFKTYADCSVSEFTPKLIDRVLLTNVMTMKKYMPELRAILEKDLHKVKPNRTAAPNRERMRA